MAADSYGPKGEPQFAGSGVPQDAADLTLLGAYAGRFGNRYAGPSTDRAAFQTVTGVAPWPGLEFYETDTGLLWINLDQVGWQLVSSADPIFSMPPSSTQQAGIGQSKTLCTATITATAPITAWVEFTSIAQISVGANNNWAGNLTLANGSKQLGSYRRVGNLANNQNPPEPMDRRAKVRLAKGQNTITASLFVDQASSTAPFVNNPQIEVWPA